VHIDGSFSNSNLFFYFIDAYSIGSNGNVAMLRLNTSVQTHASSIDTLISWQNSNPFSSIFTGPYGEIFTISSQGPLNPIFGRIPFPNDSSFLFDPNHFRNNAIGAQDFSSYLSEKVPLRMIEFPDFIHSSGCQNHPMSFSLNYSKVIDSLHWNFGESGTNTIDRRTSNPSYTYTQAGTYSVRMICFFKNFVDTITLQINILPAPSAKLPPDSFLCSNDSLLLNVSQGFPATYLWSTGSTDSSSR